MADDDSVFGVLPEGRRFFSNIRIIHIALAVVTLATGTASVILSVGSDGTATIPYFFSAFIAGCWQLVFLLLCQACIYYMSGDIKRSSSASAWVTAYSVTHSVFVLFNVMGVVFAVTNGLCLHGQLCYYDRHETANRSVAILLITEHCVCIIFSVFLAKKAHVIDSELDSDIAIKLNHHIIFSGRRTRRRSVVTSIDSTFSSTSSLGSCHSIGIEELDGVNDDNTDKGAHGVGESKKIHRHKRSKSFTKAHKKQQNNISKSHPNLHRHNDNKISPGVVIEGKIVSIYSDKEIKSSELKTKPKTEGNERNTQTVQTNAELHKIMNESCSGNTEVLPFENSDADETANSVPGDSETGGKETSSQILKQQQIDIQQGQRELQVHQQQLLSEQEKLQRQQQELLEQQRQLIQKQTENSSIDQPPPPYEVSIVETSIVNVKEASEPVTT